MSSISRTVLLAAALSAAASPALAHAHLKSAVPPIDGTVKASPSELDLSFSEGVNPAFTGVTVTGPGGAAVPTGQPALGPGASATLVVPVTGTLVPGAYTVVWHALAVDGHKTDGRYGFTIAP